MTNPSHPTPSSCKGENERGGCECAACKVVPHTSDCAVHNEPAMPAGPCSCGAWLKRARELVNSLLKADRASERSMANGGPELDEPVAVAYDALDDHLKVAASAVSPSQAQSGWKLVPLEPTEEMAYRGGEATAGRIEWDDAPDDAPDQLARAIYRSMLKAAPAAGIQSPPADPVGGEVRKSAPVQKRDRPRQLVGYDECRCILTQYCDGTCNPIFEDHDVVEMAKTLYANSPQAYRGTQPLPWPRAPLPTKLEFISKAKAAASSVLEAQPQPLTDEQILACNNTAAEDQEFSPCITAPDEDLIAFARQVLKVAGVKVEGNGHA